MKTAISIPDPVFEAAEDLAKHLAMSRSELYATAVSRFVEMYKDESITTALNEVYADIDSSIDPVLDQLQLATLPNKEW